jgi:hypothetical protein
MGPRGERGTCRGLTGPSIGRLRSCRFRGRHARRFHHGNVCGGGAGRRTNESQEFLAGANSRPRDTHAHSRKFRASVSWRFSVGISAHRLCRWSERRRQIVPLFKSLQGHKSTRITLACGKYRLPIRMMYRAASDREGDNDAAVVPISFETWGIQSYISS